MNAHLCAWARPVSVGEILKMNIIRLINCNLTLGAELTQLRATVSLQRMVFVFIHLRRGTDTFVSSIQRD